MAHEAKWFQLGLPSALFRFYIEHQFPIPKNGPVMAPPTPSAWGHLPCPACGAGSTAHCRKPARIHCFVNTIPCHASTLSAAASPHSSILDIPPACEQNASMAAVQACKLLDPYDVHRGLLNLQLLCTPERTRLLIKAGQLP